MENKKEIVALLLPVLQATRNLSDLIDLTLDETTEIVRQMLPHLSLRHRKKKINTIYHRVRRGSGGSCS